MRQATAGFSSDLARPHSVGINEEVTSAHPY